MVEPARLLPGTQLPHRQRNPTQKTTQRNGKGGVLSREEYYLLAALSHHWHHHHHHHHHITDTHTHIHALLFNFFSSPHTGVLCAVRAPGTRYSLLIHLLTYHSLPSYAHPLVTVCARLPLACWSVSSPNPPAPFFLFFSLFLFLFLFP